MLSYIVLCLIPLLGHDEFAVRQRADAAIKAFLPAGLAFVEARCDDPDVEINRRCQRLVRAYDRHLFGAIKSYPYIDSLPAAFLDRTGVMKDYLASARVLVAWGDWSNDWPDYRRATELLVWDMRREGVSRADLLGMIEEMREGERKQIAEHKAGRLTPIPR